MVSLTESQAFFAEFSAHAARIDAAADARQVEECRSLILQLQTLVSSRANSLPARDLQTYAERIDQCRRRLDEIKAPKKRFGFSKAAREAHAVKVSAIDDNNGTIIQDAAAAAQKAQVDQAEQAADNSSCKFSLRDRQDEPLVELTDVDGDVELRNLRRCGRVRIRGRPRMLYISDVDDCEVICDPVTTSVLVVGFQRSSLTVACQQMRIHKALDATFRLHIAARSIIEDCRDVSFGRLPLADYCDVPAEAWTAAGLDPERNHFRLVDDFNWLNTLEPSPNWRLIPDDDQKEKEKEEEKK